MGFLNNIGALFRAGHAVLALAAACLSILVSHWLEHQVPWAAALMDVIGPTVTWLVLGAAYLFSGKVFNVRYVYLPVAWQWFALYQAFGRLSRVSDGISTAFKRHDGLEALAQAAVALADPYLLLVLFALVMTVILTGVQVFLSRMQPGAAERRARELWNLTFYKSPVAPNKATGHDHKKLRDVEDMLVAKDVSVPFEKGGIIIGVAMTPPIPQFDADSELYDPTAKKLYDLRQRLRAMRGLPVPTDKFEDAKLLTVDPGGHMLVLAGSGTGKSACVYIPVLLTYAGGSTITLDVKGELADTTAGRREEMGWKVRRLNFQAGDSDAYDALEQVILENDSSAKAVGFDFDVVADRGEGATVEDDGLTFFQLQVDIISTGLFPENASAGSSDAGDFWRQSSANLTSVVIQYNLLDWQAKCRKEIDRTKWAPRPTLQDAYDVLQREGTELQTWVKTAVDRLAANLAKCAKEPGRRPVFGAQTARIMKDLSVYAKMDAEKVLPTLTMSISKNIRWLGNTAISDQVCGKPHGKGQLFHVDDICDGETSVYIVMNELVIDSTPGVARLVVGSFLGTLFGRSPDEVKGYVLFALDECASLKNLELIHRSGLERIRGRKGLLVAAFQGKESLAEAAGDKAVPRWMESAMYTTIIGTNTEENARAVSEMLGEGSYTELDINDNNSQNVHTHSLFSGGSGSSGSARNFRVAQYKVKTTAEILQTEMTYAYIFTRRGKRKPMLVRTCYYEARTKDMKLWAGKTAFTPRPIHETDVRYMPPWLKRECAGGIDMTTAIYRAALAQKNGGAPVPPTTPSLPPKKRAPMVDVDDREAPEDIGQEDLEAMLEDSRAAESEAVEEPVAIAGVDYTFDNEQPDDDELGDIEAAGLLSVIGSGTPIDLSAFDEPSPLSAAELDDALLAELEPLPDDDLPPLEGADDVVLECDDFTVPTAEVGLNDLDFDGEKLAQERETALVSHAIVAAEPKVFSGLEKLRAIRATMQVDLG